MLYCELDQKRMVAVRLVGNTFSLMGLCVSHHLPLDWSPNRLFEGGCPARNHL